VSDVDDHSRKTQRLDDDGMVVTQRKNYGWANASRPLDLLVKNVYTDVPGLFISWLLFLI
jgi:hypothetical protein